MWPTGTGNGNGGKRGSLPLSADINVTSLVDVAFTLLVIFIITAPILQGGVEVDLPDGEVPPINQTETVIVTLTREGTIHVGETETRSVEDFLSIFPQMMEQAGAENATLRADEEVPFGRVAELFARMQGLGVGRVLLTYDPEPRG